MEDHADVEAERAAKPSLEGRPVRETNNITKMDKMTAGMQRGILESR